MERLGFSHRRRLPCGSHSGPGFSHTIFPSLYTTTVPPTAAASPRTRAAALRNAVSTHLRSKSPDSSLDFLSCALISAPFRYQHRRLIRIVVHLPLVRQTTVHGLEIEPSFVEPPNNRRSRHVVPPVGYPMGNPGYRHVGSWQPQENQPDPVALIPPLGNWPGVTASLNVVSKAKLSPLLACSWISASISLPARTVLLPRRTGPDPLETRPPSVRARRDSGRRAGGHLPMLRFRA